MKKTAWNELIYRRLTAHGFLVFSLVFLSMLFAPDPADAARTVRAGIYNYKPLVYSDSDGSARGLYVDILNHAAKQEGWNVLYVPGTWQEGLDRLKNDQIDLLLCIGYTEERDRLLDFPKEFLLLDWGLVYRPKGSAINSIMDLEGKAVSALKGSVYLSGFQELVKQFSLNVKIVEFPQVSDVLKAVDLGTVNAGITANIAGILNETGHNVERTPIIFTPVKIGYGVNGGRNADLIAALDRTIAALKADKSSLYYQELEKLLGKKNAGIPGSIYWLAAGVTGALVLSGGFIFMLRRQVRSKTRSIIEASDQYRCMMQSTTDGFWRVGRDGRLLDVNSRYEQLSGYSRAELLGMSVDQLDQIELADDVHEHMKKLTESGFIRFETRHRRKNGTIWDVEVSASHQISSNEMIVFLRDITARKSADELLKVQRNKFKIIFEQSLAGYWDWLIQDNSEYLSPSFKDMFGYEDHELPNHPDTWQQLIFPEDLPGVFEVFNRHVESRGAVPYYNEIRYRHKNGSTVWVICTGKVIEWDEQGKPVRMIGCHIDITRRKQAEATLALQKTKLEVLLGISSLPEADVKTVADHVLSSITRMTESEYGFYGFVNEDETVMTIHSWSGEAMQNCSMADKPGDFSICTSGIWAEAVRRREPLIINSYADAHPAKKGLPEGHVSLANLLVVPFFSKGRITAVAAVANRTADYSWHDVAELTAFLTSVQAITDSKRMEHELRLSEVRFRTLVNTIPDLIWLKDENGGYLSCNAMFERFFGAKESDIVGKTDYDFVEKELADFFREHDRKAMAAGKPSSNEEWITFQDTGQRALLYTTKTPMCNSMGELIGVLGIGHDITELKLNMEERAKLEEQLHQVQKIESVGRLAGGVAHDFNNMLGVILGHTQLALMETDPSQPLHANLEEIRLAGERSADLTRQLLAFARKQTIAPKLLDLNNTVSGMLKMLQRLIGESISLSWQPAAGLWPVKVDPSQIDQILANLCVNARDSMSDHGRIVIETANLTIDEHYAQESPDAVPGGYVALTVSDNGCGMDRETMSHIFEPFFTTKGVGEGTGLGLSTVYGAVKQNGGFITVYSEPGLGTKFTIHIPRHAGQAGHADGGEEEKPLPRGNETILLVEDEPAILNMTSILLTKQGYTVLKALSPGEAVKLARESAGEIRLLITDVVMPEMNGKDLAKQLQAIHPNLKTLFMSGYTADVIAHHGVLDDGVHFIQKPFSLTAMAAMVRVVLNDNS